MFPIEQHNYTAHPAQQGNGVQCAVLCQGVPLVGREREIQEITNLLQHPEVRLLTLTGTGGVGKTRLALHIAPLLQPAFPDGVSFVSLAGLNGPSLLILAITQALGIKEAPEASLVELLQAFLAPQHRLLILDNFEHILADAPLLTILLEECPHLKILVTSRAVLHLSYEYEFPVMPLALPNLASLPTSEVLADCASVALFVQRARMIKPDFQLTLENAAAIAEICLRLDGLPLAIELAAARIKLFTPQTLLTRFDQRLCLLGSREHDRPARHHTLRANLDWSYHLLSAREQRLFRRLAVFSGGCTLQAIEGIYACSGVEDAGLLDDLNSLLENSLLYTIEQKNGELRFYLLETIREYAWECLKQSGEMAVYRQAHAEYFLRFMEQAEPELEGPEQSLWMGMLEQEYHNLRKGLTRFLKHKEEPQVHEKALRMAGALASFWMTFGALSEGQTFLELALLDSEAVSSCVRAKAYMKLGHLLCIQGRFDQAERHLQASLELARPLSFLKCIVVSLNWLGNIALVRGEYAKVQMLVNESLALARQSGRADDIAFALHMLSSVLNNQGDQERAASLAEECLRYYQQTGNRGKIAKALYLLGRLALHRGELSVAASFYEACLDGYQEVKDKVGIGDALSSLGFVAASQGDAARARSFLEESVHLRQENGNQDCASEYHALGRIACSEGNYAEAYAYYQRSVTCFQVGGSPPGLVYCLEGLAEVIAAQGYPLKAACILGCAEALRLPSNVTRPLIIQKHYEELVALLSSQLGEHTLQKARMRGQQLKPEDILEFTESSDVLSILSSMQESAISTVMQPVLATITSPAAPEGLTEREVEIFRLLAMGLTKSQIAERLIISFHTVNAHVRSIYSKVGVSSRSAATRYALEHGLA